MSDTTDDNSKKNSDPKENLRTATVDDFANVHSDEKTVIVENQDGERVEITHKKLNQKHRDKYFEDGIEALENDRELAAEFIDEIVVEPDFAAGFGVDELEAEHIDQFGMFSYQTLFWAILDGSGIQMTRQNRERQAGMIGEDFRRMSVEPPSSENSTTSDTTSTNGQR